MGKSELISYITSSQRRIFPDSEIKDDIKSASVLNNEAYSFTVAYKGTVRECLPISISAECDGAEVTVYKVGYVPVTHAKSMFDEAAHENRGSGIYPDILFKRNSVPNIIKREDNMLPYYEENEQNLLNATDVFQSVLITFNENGTVLKGGSYKIKIKITSLLKGEILGTHSFDLKVIDKSLPKSEMMYTNWFHYDCVSDIHGVKLYSGKYFKLLEKYLKNASKHQMNTLLLPAFTPPLDTFIGGKRQNVQLVKVKKLKNGYEFDFSLLEKFIKLAKKCGIEYFEHSHLFSQWGANAAPNIYADVSGKEELIFGWDTEASGKDYKEFLESYIEKFLEFAKKLKIDDKLFFHISDEPTPNNAESYGKAVDVIKNLIKDYKSGDALSDIEFYENGFVKTPIVGIGSADEFFGKCNSMWLYYTGGYLGAPGFEKCSNRLITTKPYRTRILGLHLYKYKSSGFLHWGYNYYYDRMSRGLIDPKTNPCGYKQMPGASFIVYPGLDEVFPSLREKYMAEAMNDFKALKLLENYIGYDEVIKLCEKYFGEKINAATIPESEEQMIMFREMINKEIEKLI